MRMPPRALPVSVRVCGLLVPLVALLLACSRHAVPHVPPEFDPDRTWANLERIVAIGPRHSGSRGSQELQRLLVDELTALGLHPVRESFRDDTPMGPLPFVNVFADIPGAPTSAGAAPPIVVLASHFDTKRMRYEFVGANDGGSSTAVLLELARCLVANPERRRVTYRILFVDGEEAIRPDWEGKDNTYGSRHHVSELKRTGAIDDIGACVVLDMVGDRDLGFVHERSSTPALLSIFTDAAHRIGLGQHVDHGDREIRDDHLPFLYAGIPSVNLIDFDYGPDHRYWHSAEDVLANCAPESLHITGRIVLAGLPVLEDWVLAREDAARSRQDALQPRGPGGR